MARLENSGKTALPPPPAPTRRSANPWRFSKTARRQDPVESEETSRELLEALIAETREQAPARTGRAPEPATEIVPGPATQRRGFGFWPLLVLLLITGVFIKFVMDAMESGDWRQTIPALFAILFIAHGWWRARRRQREPEDESRRSG